MSANNKVLAACLMASATSLAWADKGPAMFEMDADGEVQIAPDGQVSDYRLHSKLTPSVSHLIDRNVRGWRFEPVVVDGVPVVAKTAMHLKLQAAPAADDSYTVKITAVSFGDPKPSGTMKPPQYPSEAVGARLGAKVLLALRLDAAGNVVDVQPYQTSLDARAHNEKEAERWRRVFERASIAAAKTWTYNVSETINGRPIGTSALAPIEFFIPGHGASKKEWKAFVPGPVHPAPWMTEGQLANGHDLSTARDGEALALDSRFHLKSDVVGKTL